MPNKNFNELAIATTTDGTELVPVVSSGVTKSVSVATINAGIAVDTISDVYDARDIAQGQSSIAAAAATVAGTISQADLGAVSAGLHRSPNAVNAMFVYDTSKDSDGGAWTEKCQHTSWYNEGLSGKWLGAQISETNARVFGSSTFGTELILNGSFGNSDISIWSDQNGPVTKTVSNSELKVYCANQYSGIYTTVATEVGATYRLNRKVRGGTGTLRFRTYIGGSDQGGISTIDNGAVEERDFVFIATSNSTTILFQSWNTVADFYLDNISFRKVTTVNAVSGDYFQLTTNGQFYRLWKNLLASSAEFNSWNKSAATVLSNVIAAPDGTTTADKIVETATPNYHYVQQGATTTSLTDYTFSFYAKAAERTTCGVEIAFGATAKRGSYDLVSGVSTGTGNVSMENVGNGWWKCIFKYTTDATTTSSSVVIVTAGVFSYQGDGVSGFYAWGAQLEKGSVVTTYEPKGVEGSTSEVFRGNKRDFPKLSAIVAESTNVTIYDLTESGRPMWMRFARNGAYYAPVISESMANGEFGGFDGSSYMQIVSFTKDAIKTINITATYLTGTISGRNSPYVLTPTSTVKLSSNARTYRVFCLPARNAKFSTGDLPSATIVNINNGSIDIFKSDGTYTSIGDSGHANFGVGVIAYRDGIAYYKQNDGGFAGFKVINNIENTTPAITLFSILNGFPDYLRGTTTKQVSNGITNFYRTNGTAYVGSLRLNTTSTSKALASAITNIYNTGYMAGDIRRTYLGDTQTGVIGSVSPVGLFAAGEQGAWYDPSDLTLGNMYQEEGKTNPVTAVEQFVGWIQDKSGRGNHAFTPAGSPNSRPTLSARVNLFTRTEQLNTSPWSVQYGTVSISAATGVAPPFGSGTVFRTQGVGASLWYYGLTLNLPVGLSHKFTVYVKSAGTGKDRFRLSINSTDLSPDYVATNDWTAYSITSAGDGVDNIGWLRSSDNADCDIYVCYPDLRVANDGVNLPPYQRVGNVSVTPSDYDTVGFPKYLRFDGSTSFLQTNSINFTSTDKMTVFAGVRKLSDANTSALVELSASVSTNSGGFAFWAPDAGATYGFVLRGTLLCSIYTNTQYPSPITNVLSTSYDISQSTTSTEIVAKINGMVPTTSIFNTNAGTGNFGNHPLYIGRRGGTSLPFNGRIYSLIVRGAQSSETEIINTEQWVAEKTGTTALAVPDRSYKAAGAYIYGTLTKSSAV